MLGDAKLDEHGNVSDIKDDNVMYLEKDAHDREINEEQNEKLEDYREKGIEKDLNDVYLEVVGVLKKGKVYGLGSASQMYYKQHPSSDVVDILTCSCWRLFCEYWILTSSNWR